jgi:hypothetical protein
MLIVEIKIKQKPETDMTKTTTQKEYTIHPKEKYKIMTSYPRR